jgi:nickel-dependent lactate racemase
MRVHIAYGTDGLDLELNDAWNVQVLEPVFQPGVENPLSALQSALRNPIGTPPLAELIQPDDQIGIIVNDITRATPNSLILTAILAELAQHPAHNITVFIALGTHRRVTHPELEALIGKEFANTLRIVQNDAFDRETQVCIGQAENGEDIWINKALMECQVKILTGFIEPHFFAGFSGGGKAILPGMAALDTIMSNHRPENILDPNATWGHTHGNPLWEEVNTAAHLAGATFLLNVTLNRNREITGVFAGNLDQAHACGVEFARNTAMVPVPKPFDIVVATNSGYPLDQNLYQTVKGMSAAAQIVRPGGAILMVSECRDGIPDHGMYGKLLTQASGPEELLAALLQPGYRVQDQWQAQIQAQVQKKASVYLYSSGLSRDQIQKSHLKPVQSIENTLKLLYEYYGSSASIAVLPEGPQTIPYIESVNS